MRRFIASVVALVPLLACATNHYEDVVRIAASKHPRTCTAPYTVVSLGRWAFRVDACEGALFYRCWAQRRTMGRTQCCSIMPDAASATAAVAAGDTTGEQSTCVEFAD